MKRSHVLAYAIAHTLLVSYSALAADTLEQVVVTGRRVSEASAAIGTDAITNAISVTFKDYLGTLTPVVAGAASFRPGPARTYQLTLSASF